MGHVYRSSRWHLLCFLTIRHVQVAFGREGCLDEDQFMMTTFTVPTAKIESEPDKYLEIPEIKEVPGATLKVTYAKYEHESAKTTSTKVTAEVHSSKIRSMKQEVRFLSPDSQGPGGKVKMTLPFYVSAEYYVDNYLHSSSYP